MNAIESRGSVLVADDEPAVRELLALVLEGQGYQVRTACDGQQALDALDQEMPQIVLLDISMPEVDGIRVLHRVRHDPRLKDVPVVMLSGMNEAHDIALAMDAGADLYLTKPFALADVSAVLDRFTRLGTVPAPAPPPVAERPWWQFWN